jgi:hypothetical protein
MAGVRTTHALYNAYSDRWKRARDVAAGSDAVKAGNEKYLPRLEAHNDAQYKKYKDRATFFNATYRVLEAMLGMLFRKPPTSDTPPVLDEQLTNVNLKGDSVANFATKITYELLTVGRVGILNDHTQRPEGYDQITKLQAEQLGVRATLQMYCAESIINWRTVTINNKTVLGLVVLKEETIIVDPTDRFKETCEDRYRVLELVDGVYIMSLWRVDGEVDKLVEAPFAPMVDGKVLNEIPFYIVGPGGTQIAPEEPPMIDLIDLNVQHYRVSADYEHGCHFTGLPQPYIAGYNAGTQEGTEKPAAMSIGSEVVWIFSEPNAKAEYLEFSGTGLAALEKNLDRKESQMAILGARMLAPEKKTAETATTAAIHRTGENAILANVAVATSDIMTKALTMFAKWSGNDTECEYELNRDFMPFLLDAPFISAIVQSYIQGAISFESMFDLFQRGDLIDPEMTVEEALKAIEKEKQDRAKQAVDQAKALSDATGGPDKGQKPPPKS